MHTIVVRKKYRMATTDFEIHQQITWIGGWVERWIDMGKGKYSYIAESK